jgi:type VI secretion system secreted protein Hcp
MQMAYDMFLQIQGVPGDSTDEHHSKWIEVEAFHHGMSQAAGGGLSAQGAITGSRADHADFTITKRLDGATPLLAQSVCTGKHIPEIKLEICRALGEKTTYMVYTLRDSIVSAVTPEGSKTSADPLPFEHVSFRYGSIQWEYTPTDPTGGGRKGAPIRSGWSNLMNKPI